MIQQDSISLQQATAEGETPVVHHTLTPAQVLSWLPRNATPAQQDSAIQAHIKASEIRWSKRPDTLHLPGHDKGKNMLDVQLPQYYREGFFSDDTLFHPELPGGRYGVAGDPVPYSVHSDNVITSLLLFCFIMAVIAFSKTKDFVVRQIKHFFYQAQGNTTEVSETTNEISFQLFLGALTALLLALLYYFYALRFVGSTYVLSSPYHLIFIFLAIILIYFMLKIAIYTITNLIFFDSKRNIQWLKTFLFIQSAEGVLLYPAVIIWAYIGMMERNVIIYAVFVIILVKILTFYKSFVIFFRRNVVSLQIFLYFCALEIVPIVALWCTLGFTANSLKINY